MKEEIYYFHGVTTDGYRFTVAGIFLSELSLQLAIAVCSSDDRFEKAEGRARAVARLQDVSNAFSGMPKRFVVKSYPATYLPGEPRKVFLNAAAKCCRMDKHKLLTKFGFE